MTFDETAWWTTADGSILNLSGTTAIVNYSGLNLKLEVRQRDNIAGYRTQTRSPGALGCNTVAAVDNLRQLFWKLLTSGHYAKELNPCRTFEKVQ